MSDLNATNLGIVPDICFVGPADPSIGGGSGPGYKISSGGAAQLHKNFDRTRAGLLNLQGQQNAPNPGQALAMFNALPVGLMMLWVGPVAGIPVGWKKMDGVANAGGSGIDMTGFCPIGKSSGTPNNTVNGSNTYSPGNTGSSGTGNTGSSTTGITVANHTTAQVAATLKDHDDHTHNIAAATIANEAAVTAGAALIARDTSALVTGTVVAAGFDQPLHHSGTGSGANDLVHTVTDPGHTHTGPSHTHTVPAVTQAPASKLVYFIERCP